MRVLLLGSGGREHAIAWKISQSSILDELFIAPGNAGTKKHGKNLDLKLTDFEAIKQAVLQHAIDMVVVGPEEPLVLGIYDYFQQDPELKNVALIGPSKEGAQLEGSKDFAKAFMSRHRIPTAKYGTFDAQTLTEGLRFLDAMKGPYVLKADGLAAGKGVLIIDDLNEAKRELEEMLVGAKFGQASAKVVIEQFLAGIELSVFAITDGESFKLLPEAKDYKRIGEGDTGLNTGGMGAISPVPFADAAFMDKVLNRVVIPTIKGLKAENITYNGFVFFGLINVKGDPYVIEYNCRMGDPETEAVLPRLNEDLVALLMDAANHRLTNRTAEVRPGAQCVVVSVAGGYPEAYGKGDPISGLSDLDPNGHTVVFHAGTKKSEDGTGVVTNGGRVLAVSSKGKNASEALAATYEALSKIHYPGQYYRRDIGNDLVS
jgi:phosphoribosylamine--glycine ligase